jgi:Rrf2 family iron-sulfur cluster assembly transcriptional regulator
LVESQKGKGGGFRLTRSPASIWLIEVIEPIDRVSRWSGCFLARGRCSDDSPCAVHHRWAEVREVYLSFLTQTTIADLAARAGIGASRTS